MTRLSDDDHLIVTIDGPSGAGKSTVARLLAQRLNIAFLDTGAMYRGVAAAALDAGLDSANAEAVAELARSLHMRFRWDDDPPRLIVDGRDLTHRLRDPDVTVAVSDVASNTAVRHELVKAQRQIGLEHPRLVTEGRDQGSVVFPDAPVKFYLDATPEVRAHRRALQLRENGKDPDERKLLEQMRYRDERDRSRADGPLVCPNDAIVIDSSGLSLDEVVVTLHEHVQTRRESAGQ